MAGAYRRTVEVGGKTIGGDALDMAVRAANGDRQFARAMLHDAHGSRLSEIAKRLGKDTNYASTYKRRLMRQGIIGEMPDESLDF